MEVTESGLKGVYLIKPKVFEDPRGFFLESYNRHRYRDHGIDAEFVQDNFTRSTRGVLRGMHYQIKRGQAELVWVPEGEVFDVTVDLQGLSHLRTVGRIYALLRKQAPVVRAHRVCPRLLCDQRYRRFHVQMHRLLFSGG